MKQLKRFFSIFLALTMLLSATVFSTFSALASDYYTVTTDGYCYVTQDGETEVTQATAGEWYAIGVSGSIPSGYYCANEFNVNPNDVVLDENNNFVMPAHNISVSAVLREKVNYTINLNEGSATVPTDLLLLLVEYLPTCTLDEYSDALYLDFNNDETADASFDLDKGTIVLTSTAMENKTNFNDFTFTFNNSTIKYGAVSFYFNGLNPNYYTVRWQDENGNPIETLANVMEGATVKFDGATPTKASTGSVKYEFSCWSDGERSYTLNEGIKVTKDITLTTVFASQEVTPMPSPSPTPTNKEKTNTVKLSLRKVTVKKSAKKLVISALLK